MGMYQNQISIIAMEERNFTSSKKCRQFRLNIKAMLNVFFFDFFGLVYYEFVPVGQTVNQVFYKQVLERLREKVFHKRPETWISKSWFLHHDNAPAHSALSIHAFLTSKNIPVVPHPLYLADLAPCDFFFFVTETKKYAQRPQIRRR